MTTEAATDITVRSLTPADLDWVCEIDTLRTGVAKPLYWRRIFADFLDPGRGGAERVGLAAFAGDEPAGYLLGEVRAFEFGSPPCGWVFAVGVAPKHDRFGHASTLLEEACRLFRAAGVTTVRTMVRRDDIPVLSFFRARGFTGGAFYQLERSLEGDQ
jgi:ribosomal protein S18 acetylase RimI-like enzyme